MYFNATAKIRVTCKAKAGVFEPINENGSYIKTLEKSIDAENRQEADRKARRWAENSCQGMYAEAGVVKATIVSVTCN